MIAAAEVEVDIDTGVVTPIRLVTGMFPGRMINKGIVRGQAIGGAAQSLGMALWEEVKFDHEEFAYLNLGPIEVACRTPLEQPLAIGDGVGLRALAPPHRFDAPTGRRPP